MIVVQSNDIDNKINSILKALKVPTHLKGYEYVKKAIKLSYYDDELPNLKVVYAEIANEVNTDIQCIERNIRTFIKLTWNNNNPLINNLFKNSVGRPSNKEFIGTIVDEIKFIR